MPRVTLSEDEIIKKCQRVLKSSINAKVGTSKEIGAFLSGGYDSSLITAILNSDPSIKLHTYTVGFADSNIDEAPFAQKIAQYLKTKHTEYYFNAKLLKDLLDNFAEVYDEPLADKAALPTMLISKAASSEVELIFGGEGGDEIFASSSFLNKFNLINAVPYPARFIFSKALKLFPKSAKYIKWSKIFEQKNIENVLKYKDMTLSFSEVSKLIKTQIHEKPIDFSNSNINPASHCFDKIFPLILKSYVSDNLLTKISFAANAYHVSPKTPYLDKKFVEFLAQVDVKLKHKNESNKYILKKILENYLPLKLVDRPKRGFNVPVGEMLKNELRPVLDHYINEQRLEKEGIFDPKEVIKLKNRFLNSSSNYDEQNIWNILIFELWYEHWFNE